jgi:hypothetical protein
LDIITYSKLKKCISVDINAGHSFALTTDRDTFFTNNPTQLKENMYIYCNGQLQQYINSAWVDRSATIQGSKGDKGDAGIDGINGISPHIDETTNNWFIGTTDTGIKAIGIDGTNGTNGVSPHIGANGNWYIGETDTLVKALAIDGVDGTDGVGIQTVVDNGNNTFTVTLTNGAFTIIDKIDTINSDDVTQGITNLYITTTEKNKLANIEENAEVNNISDANATDLTDSGDTTLHYHASDRDRTNHTGTQSISTVSGLQTALDNKANKDFTLYTQKADVVSDDKIVINDSADSNAVKYVTLNQLVSSVQDPHNKGYFDTGLALNTALPIANDGDFAVVGATETVWVWSSASNAFVDSGANGAVTSINGRTGVITLTKADVGLNNVVNLDTSTTANITDSTDKRFVTDANLVVLGNTSGTNTGDETNSSIITKLGYTPVNSDITTYTTKETLASADYILIADSEAENGLKKVTKDVLGLPDLSLYALKSKMFYPDNQYGGIISDNLNTLTVSGFYTCYGTAIGVPSIDYSWFVYHHNSNVGTTSAYQRAVAYSDTAIVYERTKTSNLWSDWTRFDTTNITSLINNKQSLPIVRDYTLSSANWVGTAEPYTYTLEVLNTDSNDIIDVSTQNSATYTQVQDIANAKIYQIIQSENTLTFKAGVLPTSDLLISVVIWKG